MIKYINLFLFLSLTTYATFATEETAGAINANTLQGLTSSAFATTNELETLKVTIERLQSHSEACADSIVDLQLGLSTISHEERLVREKDLDKIIEDYANISSELASISNVGTQGDRSGTEYALQSDLENLEAELLSLQNYVQIYLGHLKSQNEKWYFTMDGALLGTNLTMSAQTSPISSTILIGQTFQVKTSSSIRSIRLKVGPSAPPYGNVFISPFGTSIDTNTFVYATSTTNEGDFINSYHFNDYPVSTNSIYIFGVRSRNSSPYINLLRCADSYTGATNCLWTGTGTRYSLDAIKTYDLVAQPGYDLCFDIDFTSQTNIIMSADGIELKNDANLKINGQDVATVPEIRNRIAEASNGIYHSLSNHVFGASSIANGSITTVKLADNAVTASKIASNAIETAKIVDGAITSSKMAIGAVTSITIDDDAVMANKIANNAVSTSKIADNAITGNKIQNNAISNNHIIDGAISSNKVESNSLYLSHLSNVLKSNIVLSSGGTVTGKLNVSELSIKNEGNWHIGTETNKTDIIIDNQEAYIATLDGDLNLIANGTNRLIRAFSFLSFDHRGQCGKVTITAGDTSEVIANNLSSNAVVNITPAQDTLLRYWVDIDDFGEATINISGTNAYELSFYYSIMKK